MSRAIDATTGAPVEVFDFPKEINVRLPTGDLAIASSAELALRFDAEERGVDAVILTLTIYRSEVMKLVKSGVVSMSLQELAAYAPLKPMLLLFEGVEALRVPFGPALAEGRALSDCVTAPGAHGFPAFFDLENYAHRALNQPA